MIELVLLIVGFIVLSGILAMVDAAILSIERAEVEEMVMHKKYGSSALRWIAQHITKAVVVIVIATNIVNVLGPILVGQKAVNLFGSTAIGVITAILTFGTIIFSEIIPKSLGAHYAPIISRISAPVILSLIWVLYPVVYLLEKFAKLFKTGKRKIGTEAQIRSLVRLGHKAGHIESDEGQLIHRAFILNDKKAKNVMHPKSEIVAIHKDATLRDAAQVVFDHSYSRYPVYGKNLDDVVGVVMSKDVLEELTKGNDKEPVSTIQRDILLINAKKRCDDLLVLFRDRNIHLAIVRENKKTIGLVTLEDVLEELVGEIEDEADAEEKEKSKKKKTTKKK